MSGGRRSIGWWFYALGIGAISALLFDQGRVLWGVAHGMVALFCFAVMVCDAVEDAVERGMQEDFDRVYRRQHRDTMVVNLDPAIQRAFHERRCREQDHEVEVLDGVDTCIICGAIRLPSGDWLYEYARTM